MSPITEFWILYWTELLILGTILGLVALVLCRIWHQKKIAHQDEKISRVHELSGDLERNTDQMREGLHNLGGRLSQAEDPIAELAQILSATKPKTKQRGRWR
jgi:DNA anti-recombination protein RmuC